MSVGGVEDAGAGQVAEELFVLLDLLVATREVEGDFLHVVDAGVPDVPDFQAGGGDLLLQAGVILVGSRGAAAGDVHVLDAELADELQLLVAGVARDLHRELDARGPGREFRGAG